MKKLVFLFAMVFASIMVFAQGPVVYPTDYPTGYPNVLGDNTAIVDQDGNTNEATVDQISGTDNYTEVKQEISSSEATVWQEGNTNFAFSHQKGGSGDAIGFIYQIGDENIVDAQYQGSWGSADVYAYARQEGLRNFAIQSHHENKDASTIVNQTGNDNRANQYQRQGFSGGPGNVSSEIHQTGDWNEAYTEQRGLGGHSITITQEGCDPDVVGDYNFANLKQAGDGGHSATVVQGGNNNRVEDLLGTGGAYEQLGDSFNSLEITQCGDYNTVLGYQNEGASATITQTGNTNSLVINQDILP